MIVADVIRGEGFASAMRRAAERVSEAAGSLLARPGHAAILNVSSQGIAPRTGGVAVQLMARLREERALRGVALLHPRGRWIDSVREAMSISGAAAVHIEGTSGVPIADVLGLGVPVVVSVHDFSLFCARPHLIEQPMGRFCGYSMDLDRCARCLGRGRDEQAERRELARRLLESATGVIFPSQFLLDNHRELFSLPLTNAAVVEPAGPASPRRARAAAGVAYAGAVKRHKGAHLLPEIASRLKETLHVFGGGDVDLLRALRRLPNVVIHGYYRAAALPSLLDRHRVGLVVLPSIWPETYSLTLSEAWLGGAAVAAFDLGAPAERIRRDGGGWLAPLESGAAGLIAIVERWLSGERTAIPRVVASPAAAARAHVELYRKWRVVE
jgi:glycosyltransferase involved in cell wall biosynthesis